MSQQHIQKIRQRIDQIQQNYQHSFAGHPRASRNAQLLSAWVTQLEQWQIELKSFSITQTKSTLDQIAKLIKLYQTEETYIEALQATNDATRKMYAYQEWTGMIKQRYQRHFAGQSRATRDAELLKEIILELKIHQSKLENHQKESQSKLSENDQQDLSQHIESIGNDLKLYQSELQEITNVRTTLDHEAQGNLFAQLANDQFQLYKFHFGGKARSSRRLDLLERICTSLTQVKTAMIELNDFDDQINSKNIEIVENNLTLYQQETQNVQSAQNQMSYEAWIETLSDAYADVQNEYRDHFAGQSRATRDLVLITHMTDELYDLAYQMKPFLQNSPHQEDIDLLNQVLDQVRNYQKEIELIKQAKAQASKQKGISKTGSSAKKSNRNKNKKKKKKLMH